MKKEVILLSLLFILQISLASAVEIKLSKETYQPKETLQAEIYGEFLQPLEVENIIFYRERNIPVEFDILKLKEKYLLYAILPIKEGNYSIKIKNVEYETETGTGSSEIIKEFEIKASNETLLTFKPGFILTKEDFYVEFESNKNLDTEAEFLNEKYPVSLIANRESKVTFSVEYVNNYTEAQIKIQEYEIPVVIYKEKSPDIVESGKFRFNPLELEATILKGEFFTFKVSLINLGKKDLENIEISSNFSSSKLTTEIFPTSIINLSADSVEYVNLTFSSNTLDSFYGTIKAVAGNLSTTIDVYLNTTENASEVNSSSSGFTLSTCEEEAGTVCGAKERCEGSIVFTSEGDCCKGECKKEKKSTSWIYGLVIIVLVLGGLVGVSFYMKKRQKKSLDILKERGDRFENRMKGEEITGSLSKS